MKNKTKLTTEQLNLISGGLTMPFGVKIGINSPLFVVNLNLGVLVVAGNKFNGGVTIINFGQQI